MVMSAGRVAACDVATGDDTELNMTPMIDIVFQLIIFFLLSLKFKNVDRRIDAALPKDRGPAPVPTPVDDLEACKVKVFVRDLGTPRQRTVIRVGQRRETFALPAVWRGHTQESPARVRAYRETMAALRTAMEVQFRSMAFDKQRGEIVARSPRGGAVPHGDVMAILNEFLQAGVTDVVFEGASKPR